MSAFCQPSMTQPFRISVRKIGDSASDWCLTCLVENSKHEISSSRQNQTGVHFQPTERSICVVGSMVNRNDWIMSAAGSSLRKDFVPRQIGRHWVGLGGEWPRRCSSIDRFSWDGSDVIGKQAKMLRNFRVLSYRTTPYCFLSWAMVSVKACLQF